MLDFILQLLQLFQKISAMSSTSFYFTSQFPKCLGNVPLLWVLWAQQMGWVSGDNSRSVVRALPKKVFCYGLVLSIKTLI